MNATLLFLDTLTGPLQYAFFQKGLMVATISGALLGFVGVYITLRGMSYIGHGLSHAIFGGFAAASLVSASFIYIGAGIWGVSSALAINWVTRKHRIGADAAIGVITTASFALGVALLSYYGSSGPSFDNALFGSIYGISPDQIVMLIGVSVATAAFVFFRYRSLLFTTFDPEVAAASGRQCCAHRGDVDAPAVAVDPCDADRDRRHARGRHARDSGGGGPDDHRLFRADADPLDGNRRLPAGWWACTSATSPGCRPAP